MYIDGMTHPQAREWARALQSELDNPEISTARREQAAMDLQDVQAQISALEA